MSDNLNEDLIDGGPEDDEQEIVGPANTGNGGLSDESREAIHGGAERIFADKNRQSQVAGRRSQDSGTQPANDKQQTTDAKQQPKTTAQASSGKPSVPTTDNPARTTGVQSGGRQPTTNGGSARGKSFAQGARIGADIARNPREGATEAGKAVVGRAAKKATKEGAKKLAEMATVEFGGPLIIEAADKLASIASKATSYIPGAGIFSNWVDKHKVIVIVLLFLLTLLPFVGFAVGYASGSDGSGGIDTDIAPFTGNADQLLLYPSNLDATKMAQAIDQFIAQKQPNSPMNGLGSVFVESARAYGINPFFTVSQAAYENQFGTSPRPVPGYNSTGSFNPFGIIAEGTAGRTRAFFDGVRYVRYAKYNNYQEGILAHDKVVKNLLDQGNTTFDGMINKYVGSLNRERVNQQILAINQMMTAAGGQ